MHPFYPLPLIKYLLLASLLFFHTLALADTRVSTDWLNSHLNDPNLIVIDMTDGIQYQRFHVPGARHLPYQAINTNDRYGISHSSGSAQLINVLGQLGIRSDSHVVIYDDLGGLNASRLYWELEGLGHRRVSLLDGGLVKWILEGREVSNQTGLVSKTTYTPALPGYAVVVFSPACKWFYSPARFDC